MGVRLFATIRTEKLNRLKDMTTTSQGGAMEDFNELKGYFLGTLALGAAATTFFTQAFHTPLESTLIVTTGIGIFFLTIVYLITKAEQRARRTLREHERVADERDAKYSADVQIIKDAVLENQRSILRQEMDNEMYRNPSNHDTIIKYAHRYFHDLNGDWVQTEKFLTWMKKEGEAGRPVNLPPDLWANVQKKAQREGLLV